MFYIVLIITFLFNIDILTKILEQISMLTILMILAPLVLSELAPIVFKDQGVVLNPQGYIAIAPERIRISLMMKLTKPSLLTFDKNCRNICSNNKLTSFITDRDDHCIQWNQKPTEEPYQKIETGKFLDNIRTCLITCQHDNCKWIQVTMKGCRLYHDTQFTNEANNVMILAPCVLQKISQKCDLEEQKTNIIAEALNQDINDFWKEITTQVAEIDNKQNRQKRQIAMVVGAAGVLTSLVTSGFNFFNNMRLEQKMKTMQEDFRNFAENVHEFEENTYDFENEIIKVIDSIKIAQERSSKDLTCKTDQLTLALLQYREMNRFKERVNEILKPLNDGKRTAMFTPRLVNISTIQDIINNHPKLQDTLYKEQPTLIYATSKATIAEVAENKEGNAMAIHLILTIPTLKNQHVYQYFKTAQTGFYYDEKCWEHEIPNIVFQKISIDLKTGITSKAFYSLDAVHCEGESNLFMFCDININKAMTNPLKLMEAECLSETPNTCNMSPVACKDKILYNVHGLLTMSHNEIKGVLKEITEEKKIVTWNPNDATTRTSYWPWKTYDYVEFNSGIARAVDYEGEIVGASEEQQNIWWKTIKKTNDIMEARNLSKAYSYLRKSLKGIENQRQWFSDNHSTMTKDITLTIVIVLIVIIIIVVALCYGRQKFEKKQEKGIKRKIKEDKYSDTDEEPSPEEMTIKEKPLKLTSEQTGSAVHSRPQHEHIPLMKQPPESPFKKRRIESAPVQEDDDETNNEPEYTPYFKSMVI